MCDNGTKCIYVNLGYVCDGHRHCLDGQDENIDECKSRNTFPKQATVQCFEVNRPDKYSIEIMAIPCNGKRECKNGEDEMGCDVSLIYLLTVLLIGFVTISLVAGIFDNYHKRAKGPSNVALGGSKQEDLPFPEWHQNIDRAKQISFYQGTSDRRQKNLALIADESSFHGNFTQGILCLKVIFKKNFI